jgi:EAL domain-containing protein (putative c-di-GMP-specific phosphodiesterase class I)
MTAVGEGVETHEQLAALQALGCQLGQGFLFARPMGSAEFSLILAEHRGTTAVLAG